MNSSVRMMFAVALTAMIVRAMIPAGWMLAADPASGTIRVELCTGKMTLAAQPATVEPSSSGHAAHDPHAHHGPDHGTSHSDHAMHAGHDMHGGPGTADDHDQHDHDLAEPACPFALASILGQADAPIADTHQPVLTRIDLELPPLRGPPPVRVVFAPLPARGPPSSI